jgi:hypothetical protein
MHQGTMFASCGIILKIKAGRVPKEELRLRFREAGHLPAAMRFDRLAKKLASRVLALCILA